MNLWNWIKEIIYRPAFFVDQAFTLKQGLKFYAGLIALFVMVLSLIALPGTVRFVHEVLIATIISISTYMNKNLSFCTIKHLSKEQVCLTYITITKI